MSVAPAAAACLTRLYDEADIECEPDDVASEICELRTAVKKVGKAEAHAELKSWYEDVFLAVYGALGQLCDHWAEQSDRDFGDKLRTVFKELLTIKSRAALGSHAITFARLARCYSALSDAGSNDGSAGASSVEGGAGGVGGVPHSPMHRTMPVPKKAAAPKAVLDTPRRHATSVAAELEQFAEKNNADVEALCSLEWAELVGQVEAGGLSLGARAWLKGACARGPVDAEKQAGSATGGGMTGEVAAAAAARAPASRPARTEAEKLRSRLRVAARAELLDQSLALYAEVDEWAFAGSAAEERLAADYLVRVYRSGLSGDEYADAYITSKGLQGCKAMESFRLCLHVMDLLLVWDKASMCNSAAVESLARYAYGLEVATEGVHERSDWVDSKRSKTKFHMVNQYSTLSAMRVRRIAKADESVRKEMERGALMAKWISKAETAGGMPGGSAGY